MNTLKFSEIFDFQKKSNIKAGEGLKKGQHPFYTSSSDLSKYIEIFQYDKPSLIFGTGGNANIHLSEIPFSTSTDCLVAQIKNGMNQKFSIKFVYYFLFGNIWILKKGFKGAGLKHISKEYIKDINIPNFTYEEQIKIVKILEQVDALRHKRKQVLRLLDEYIKSVFLKMFSKNATGFNKWRSVKLEVLAKDEKGSMRTGPFGSDLLHSEFVEEGIAVIGIDNAVQNKFVWNERRYITKEKYKKLKRYTLFPRDVIITIMGTNGKSAVIPDYIPLAINTKHLAAITLNQQVANPYFISYSFHSNPEIANQLKANSKGAIMAGLNLGVIKNLIFKLPPIELQNYFEEIFNDVEEVKQKMINQSFELEIQFQAIIQKSFKIN